MVFVYHVYESLTDPRLYKVDNSCLSLSGVLASCSFFFLQLCCFVTSIMFLELTCLTCISIVLWVSWRIFKSKTVVLFLRLMLACLFSKMFLFVDCLSISQSDLCLTNRFQS